MNNTDGEHQMTVCRSRGELTMPNYLEQNFQAWEKTESVVGLLNLTRKYPLDPGSIKACKELSIWIVQNVNQEQWQSNVEMLNNSFFYNNVTIKSDFSNHWSCVQRSCYFPISLQNVSTLTQFGDGPFVLPSCLYFYSVLYLNQCVHSAVQLDRPNPPLCENALLKIRRWLEKLHVCSE